MTALVVDYIQKGSDSAFLFMTEIVNQYALARFNIEAVPPFIYIFLLIAAGFALVYIFEPDNKRNAFYAGAGVLGFLATFAPVEPEAIQVSPGAPLEYEELMPGPEAHLFNGAPVIKAAWRPVERQRSYDLAQAQELPVRVFIRFPRGQSATSLPSIYAALHDFTTDRTYKLGGGGRLVNAPDGPMVVYDLSVMTGRPSGSTIAELALRVEASGYTVGYTEKDVSRGADTPVEVSVRMKKSNLPLAIERLRHPRTF